jgi:signal recognition particle subunit SRP54
MLKEIVRALMESDINIKLIQNLRNNVKTSVNLDENTGAVNKKRNIQKVCRIVTLLLTSPCYRPIMLPDRWIVSTQQYYDSYISIGCHG